MKPTCDNKIGVVFDCAIPQKVLNVHINTINAVKTVYGVDVVGYELTKEACGVEFFMTESGVSSGELRRPQALLDASKKLIEKGANAIAVVTLFDDPDESDGYSQGEAVDIVGGIEAVISHYLSSTLNMTTFTGDLFSDFHCDFWGVF